MATIASTDEQIAIEVLETIMNGVSNPNKNVSTKDKTFSFTYEDLISDRSNAYYLKKKIMSDEELNIFKN